VYENLELVLDTADRRLAELAAEIEKSLSSKTVSLEAVQLTHEVCEKLRSALDRVAHRYWNLRVSSSIEEPERKRASIYFPVAADQNDFDSVLGRWRWRSVKSNHQAVYDYLRAQQPFVSPANKWLATLNDLAVASKHIDLVPQKRIEERRITVTGPNGGSVSWGPGVIFGNGVLVNGAPIDPATQRIRPTPGVTERIEVWVAFVIQGYGVDALAFCRLACAQARRIVTEMTEKFAL
jgi:hypothetical protein